MVRHLPPEQEMAVRISPSPLRGSHVANGGGRTTRTVGIREIES